MSLPGYMLIAYPDGEAIAYFLLLFLGQFVAVGGEGFAERGIWSATRRIHVAPTAWQPRL
jgi:hypothetical protein